MDALHSIHSRIILPFPHTSAASVSLPLSNRPTSLSFSSHHSFSPVSLLCASALALSLVAHLLHLALSQSHPLPTDLLPRASIPSVSNHQLLILFVLLSCLHRTALLPFSALPLKVSSRLSSFLSFLASSLTLSLPPPSFSLFDLSVVSISG